MALLLLSFKGYSQPQHLSSAAQNLHNLFKGVSKVSSPSANLHYGRSAHVVDERYFDYQYSDLDTNYQAQWFRMYDEVRYMHWHTDTGNLDIADSVYQEAITKYAGDTIPIGIMDYKFYRLKEDALTTNTYYNFNTTDNSLHDKSGRPTHGFKNTLSQLFAASPLKKSAVHSTVTYTIDPDFIFKDGSQGTYQNQGIRVDYGDGSGFHTYSGSLNSPIHETIISYDAGKFFEFIDVSNLTPGTYFLKAQGKKQTFQSKFIKK